MAECIGGKPLPTVESVGDTGLAEVQSSGSQHSELAERVEAQCSKWAAWRDSLPPGPEVLHVVGECSFPTCGYKVRLRRMDPQEAGSLTLVLEQIICPTGGPVEEVVSTVEVHYWEETSTHYRTVHFLPEDVSIPVEDVLYPADPS